MTNNIGEFFAVIIIIIGLAVIALVILIGFVVFVMIYFTSKLYEKKKLKEIENEDTETIKAMIEKNDNEENH